MEWINCEERPLFTKDEKGIWTCTEDGDKPFIAAVPYNDTRIPGTMQWWIKHCVIDDEVGLCVVGDDENTPAEWSMEDITHYIPQPEPPKL